MFWDASRGAAGERTCQHITPNSSIARVVNALVYKRKSGLALTYLWLTLPSELITGPPHTLLLTGARSGGRATERTGPS